MSPYHKVFAVLIGLCVAWAATPPAGAQTSGAENQHGFKIELPKNPFSFLFSPRKNDETGIQWQDLVPPEGQGTLVQLDAAMAERKGAPGGTFVELVAGVGFLIH